MSVPTHRPPDRSGAHHGLAYLLWLPERAEPPWPGVVILHGAGSRKENHADFARVAAGNGWAALAFDAPGHGESEGEMSPAAVSDVVRMVRMLRSTDGVDPERVALRGSSMGGLLAIHAALAGGGEVAGVIAICPAEEAMLRRGLRRDDLEMRVGDREELDAWLASRDVREAVAALEGTPLLLMHAEGDERIPSQFSEELYARSADPSKLIVVPGGNHRSVQHDEELQAAGLRWLERELEATSASRRVP